MNSPGSWGLQKQPEPKPQRFSVSYHLLRVESGAPEAPRIRLQVWCEDGEPVPSVVSVWPTADWHEREAWDMMGIRFEGHPNLVRILMEDDWDGHPLRKDYPLGGRAGALLRARSSDDGRHASRSTPIYEGTRIPSPIADHARRSTRRCATRTTSSRSTSARTTPRPTASSVLSSS